MPEDRDLAVVWQQEQRLKCSDCGTAPWEWDENPDAWHADHDTCEGCRKLQAHARIVHNSPGSQDGVKLALYRTAREE